MIWKTFVKILGDFFVGGGGGVSIINLEFTFSTDLNKPIINKILKRINYCKTVYRLNIFRALLHMIRIRIDTLFSLLYLVHVIMIPVL